MDATEGAAGSRLQGRINLPSRPADGSREASSHVHERQNLELQERGGVARSDGGAGAEGNKLTRRPRPPVDAWGTPPASTNRKGSAKAGKKSDECSSVSFRGNGDDSQGGAGEGGLLPSLTGDNLGVSP